MNETRDAVIVPEEQFRVIPEADVIPEAEVIPEGDATPEGDAR